MTASNLTLTEYVLLASLEISGGDLEREFTAEELLVAAWKENPEAFGLRGFEHEYPDSNKLYTKLDGRDGLVARGLLTKAGERVLKLTPVGLASAAGLRPADGSLQTKLHRVLQERVTRIIGHPVFRDWLNDPNRPKHFREAGHFWGIAPGTPAATVREKVLYVEKTLIEALRELDRLGTDVIAEQKGKPVFERIDLERSMEFQKTLKERFRKDLLLLDPEGPY